jgi:hypothetical protein
MGYGDMAGLTGIPLVDCRVEIFTDSLKAGSRKAVAIETKDRILVGAVVDPVVPVLKAAPPGLHPQQTGSIRSMRALWGFPRIILVAVGAIHLAIVREAVHIGRIRICLRETDMAFHPMEGVVVGIKLHRLICLIIV